MGWSGGTFSRVHNWTSDAAGPAPNIEASRMDAEDDSFEAGIDACIHKGGQNTPTADLPMGTQKHTGVGSATARDQYTAVADLQDQDHVYAVDTGSADAYAIAPSPAITAYEEGQRFVFRATNANTGASTLAVSGLTATAIQTPDGSALVSGDIIVGGFYEVVYDANAAPDRWVLTSPSSRVPYFADSDVDHDATTNYDPNDHIDHTTVTITAGSGLSYSVGGTDISADATIDLDLSSLTQIDATDLVAGDEVVVLNGGANKALRMQDFGVMQVDDTTQTPLSGADLTFANKVYNCSNASAITATIPANGAVAYPIGTVLGFCQTGAGTVTVAVTSDTLNSPDSLTDTRVQYSTIYARKTAATTWVLSGDLA